MKASDNQLLKDLKKSKIFEEYLENVIGPNETIRAELRTSLINEFALPNLQLAVIDNFQTLISCCTSEDNKGTSDSDFSLQIYKYILELEVLNVPDEFFSKISETFSKEKSYKLAL